MGAVLKQYNQGNWELLGFFSKKFNPAQRNYSTYDRELQAIYSSLKFFKSIVEGRKLIIKTDHKPLIFLTESSKASPRQLRQLDFIGQFCTKSSTSKSSLQSKNLRRHTDEELKDLLQNEAQSLQLKKIRVDNSDTVVYCDISKEEIRPYVPKSLRKRVFDVTHLPEKQDPQTQATRTRALPTVPDTRFDHVHMDIIGPLPNIKGYRYCVTMIDRFTRWPEAVPVQDISADIVVDALFHTWIAHFGAPTTIITDQRTQFESQLTTAYHPVSNGIIERWHRSLKTAIRCHESKNWLQALPVVLLGLRTSIKEDIKATAAELVYGTTLRLSAEYFFNEDVAPEPETFIQHFREHMQNVVRSTPTAHHSKKKTFTHKTLYTCTHVFVRVDKVKGPLEPPYEGPYPVSERITDHVFKVLIKGEAVNISVDRFKPVFMEARFEEEGESSSMQATETTKLRVYPRVYSRGSDVTSIHPSNDDLEISRGQTTGRPITTRHVTIAPH
ncbi:uncharacterized protein LOC112637135 [Camponotus floridanus]|uniref:uncharacterized protein LOC112637135 n=1 Tax=Camponotus floridanus TaxID=104421 RepID=UPI000DC6B4D7|nr:uncharacterized protein LOC112637135 [Camponotus floridanus]